MNKKRNIILFSWNNLQDLEKSLSSWIQLFSKKHSKENILRFHAENHEDIDLRTELTTSWFFVETRLIIIEDIFSNKILLAKYQDLLFSILDKIPETTFVIFVSRWVNKKPKKSDILITELNKISTLKTFSLPENAQVIPAIRSELNIDLKEARLLAEKKWYNFAKIQWEILKLGKYFWEDKVSGDIINKIVKEDIEVVIFSLTDAIASWNRTKAYSILESIENSNDNPFLFLMTFIWILRTVIYILKLKELNYSESQIASVLKKSPYMVKKAFNNRSVISNNSNNIFTFYSDIVKIDTDMKLWNLIWWSEKWIFMSIKKAILR